MEYQSFQINELMNERRHDVDESLRPISAAELRALTSDLFPYQGHPWLEKYLEVINNPAGGDFYHALVDRVVHVFYCHDRNIGMWFIPGSGAKGALQPEELRIMKEAVEGRR